MFIFIYFIRSVSIVCCLLLRVLSLLLCNSFAFVRSILNCCLRTTWGLRNLLDGNVRSNKFVSFKLNRKQQQLAGRTNSVPFWGVFFACDFPNQITWIPFCVSLHELRIYQHLKIWKNKIITFSTLFWYLCYFSTH